MARGSLVSKITQVLLSVGRSRSFLVQLPEIFYMEMHWQKAGLYECKECALPTEPQPFPTHLKLPDTEMVHLVQFSLLRWAVLFTVSGNKLPELSEILPVPRDWIWDLQRKKHKLRSPQQVILCKAISTISFLKSSLYGPPPSKQRHVGPSIEKWSCKNPPMIPTSKHFPFLVGFWQMKSQASVWKSLSANQELPNSSTNANGSSATRVVQPFKSLFLPDNCSTKSGSPRHTGKWYIHGFKKYF